jgi:hypothetical protein
MRSGTLRRTGVVAVLGCALAAQASDGESVVGTFMVAALPFACFCALICWLSHHNLRFQVEGQWARWRKAMTARWAKWRRTNGRR